MSYIFRLGGILMLTTVIAAASLSGVYSVTKPMIDAQQRIKLQSALAEAITGADPAYIKPVEKDGTILYYIGYSSADTSNVVGYAFLALAPGYSSVIESMVGVDSAGHVLGIKVLKQVETPGLGTKIEEIKHGETTPWFTRQYFGKKADQIAVDKDGGEIISITGATISSRALTRSIVSAFGKFQSDLIQTKSF